MNAPSRTILPLGALSAAMAVGLGAYAAHGLDDSLIASGYEEDLSQRLAWFETGVRYQMYHSLGLLLVGLIGTRSMPIWGTAACFLLGILLFSGSLYGLAIFSSDHRWLGAVVPLGGLSFIVGWVMLAWRCWRDSIPSEV